jgi:cardiolipin synthase
MSGFSVAPLSSLASRDGACQVPGAALAQTESRRMRTDLQPPAVERASYPPRRGNHVEVLIDGHETFRAIGNRLRSATRSVWVTVSFVELELRPFGAETGTLLEELDAAAQRGVDVRLLFWWSEFPGIGSFRGEDDELVALAQRGIQIKMRWDHIPRGCHHQKSWVVDGDTAFVGGINLTVDGCSDQHHENQGHHDLFTAIRGPAVADVAENFAQRWNQASRFDQHGHAFPSRDGAGAISTIPDCRDAGESTVQIVRTIRRGLYRGQRGWHGAHAFELHDGERSIHSTIHRWIDAANTRIYLENQYLLAPDTLESLRAAAARGVEVIAVCPFKPDPNLVLYPKDHLVQSVAALDSLAKQPGFAMFGLLRHSSADGAVPIYVHSKVMIIDDRLLGVGSANLWPPSYSRDSELNVCVWDTALALATRRRLWLEHLGSVPHDSIDDWRRLARDRPAGARIAEIDPSAYYRFSQQTEAPWADIEPRD